MRSLALLTPSWIPDCAYLRLMQSADVVLLQDTSPYQRKARINRTSIRTPEGIMWLHVPILQEDRSKPIHQIRIDHREPWQEKHLASLSMNYRNSIYFDHYEDEIRADYEASASFPFLLDWIMYANQRLFTYLELEKWPELTRSSDRFGAIEPELQELLYATQCAQLLVEEDAHRYKKIGQSLTISNDDLPAYRQHFGRFFSGCGLFDLLFELGTESWRYFDAIKFVTSQARSTSSSS